MKTISCFIKRNIKLYFKDKATFFCSLITPLILLLLYVTFLGNVYKDSILSIIPEGFNLSKKVINGFVGGQLFSSILAVSCVTVPFCANLIMISDKMTGAYNDFLITPVKKSTLSLGYYIATVFNGLIIAFIAVGACFIYLGVIGWYLSATDILLIILDIFLLVLFGTAFSSLVCFNLTTQGQMSAVGTIVSSTYGFVCGAYMPLNSFSAGLRNVLMFLPGTYGTSLIRNHSLRGALTALSQENVPDAVIDGIKKGFDCTLEFFGNTVSIPACYIVLCVWIVLLLGAYIALNYIKRNKSK